MAVPRKGWRVAAVLLLIGVYLLLQYLSSRPHAPAMVLPPVQEREPFPVDLVLPDLQGNTIRLSYLRGQVVLLNVWATWCYPCRIEMPSMQDLYQGYRARGFEILAIAIDIQGTSVVAPFVEQYRLTFPILLDPENSVGPRLQVQGIPTSYLLDKRGRIAGFEIGPRDWNSKAMQQVLEQLLSESANDATP
jgi:peroxiredoxin